MEESSAEDTIPAEDAQETEPVISEPDETAPASATEPVPETEPEPSSEVVPFAETVSESSVDSIELDVVQTLTIASGEEIIATPTHPFYSPVKGWTEAAKLRAGDILVLVNGEYVVVEKVQHEILEAPVTVYNFQVEDFHTYYVSSIGCLVHNSCYQPIREGDFRAVINPGELEAPHAHIFQKANNIGRIFKNGKMDDSLKNNKDAMKFVKRKMDQIMELIDDYYGER